MKSSTGVAVAFVNGTFEAASAGTGAIIDSSHVSDYALAHSFIGCGSGSNCLSGSALRRLAHARITRRMLFGEPGEAGYTPLFTR